ncbi:hypothetical protein WA026_015966 [Henosepilachna vigintioctopunctata]|uniref:Mothers against decapentaplegic homolog n=1 Tax=Henosepilachna vigintioctopunctata TaxID=420089 RepID=A0AAW1U9K8_9CUCU
MNSCKGKCAAKKGMLSKLNNLFSTSNPAVEKLMNWRQSDEDDTWAEKSVQTLVKKLKNKKGALQELERALTSPGIPTRCVTIRKSSDGRLQISHKKLLPHIISCRIWRWPDLQINSELKPVEYCQYSYSKKLKEICINPYHYERVESNILPPVLVPRYNHFVQGYTPRPYQEPRRNMPQNVVYSENGFSAHSSNSCQTSSGQASSFGSSTPYCGQNSYQTYCAQGNFPTSRTIYEDYTNSDNFPNDQQYLSADLRPVAYQEQQIWCSIAYYEFNFRVGELFTCPSSSIIVDGFTNPNRNSTRFCLGRLSNVKRTPFVEAVRQRIGEGVLLYYGGGKVHLRNLSKSPIFVQSRNLNQQQNFHVSTVCKIPAGYSSPLEIFNNLAFAQELSKCVHYGFDAVYELRKMCTIRLSFVKGWGKEYQRDDITGIPCWIEIHLHGALEWLDRVVKEMGGSADPITSVS